MRTHGVSDFPDANRGGAIPKETPQQLGVSASRLQAAVNACRHLIPAAGQPTQAALQRSWLDFRTFARCMRRRGVTGWPDPTPYPNHPERPTFALQTTGLVLSSPRVARVIRACVPLLHGTNPQRLGESG